jgi:hypothetical protein
LAGIQRSSPPDIRTLLFDLIEDFEIWYDRTLSSTITLPFSTSCRDVLILAKARTICISFDYNHVHKVHRQTFKQLVSGKHNYKDFPAYSAFVDKYTKGDWAIFNDIPPAYEDASASRKRSRQGMFFMYTSTKSDYKHAAIGSSPTLPSPPPKRVQDFPGSPTEIATPFSIDPTIEFDPQPEKATSYENAFDRALARQLPLVLRTILPELLSDALQKALPKVLPNVLERIDQVGNNVESRCESLLEHHTDQLASQKEEAITEIQEACASALVDIELEGAREIEEFTQKCNDWRQETGDSVTNDIDDAYQELRDRITQLVERVYRRFDRDIPAKMEPTIDSISEALRRHLRQLSVNEDWHSAAKVSKAKTVAIEDIKRLGEAIKEDLLKENERFRTHIANKDGKVQDGGTEDEAKGE